MTMIVERQKNYANWELHWLTPLTPIEYIHGNIIYYRGIYENNIPITELFLPST